MSVEAQVELAIVYGMALSDMTTAEGGIDFAALSLHGKPPECPCQGSFRLAVSASETYVYCTFHGDPAERQPGTIDPGYSSLRWLMLWLRNLN
ncbi:MAG TPA: hypothetical protein DCG57_21305 [Candidatus Riflebacteria bacterium]|nr:hypothetical protein [Candidatus Riflebacteria bacterium]